MEKAKSRPVNPDDLKNIFCRTGNLQFGVAAWESGYEGGLFAPVSLLNEFRRDLFAGVERILAGVCLPPEDEISKAKEKIGTFLSSLCSQGNESPSKATDPVLSVYVSSIRSTEGALRGGCRRIYYELETTPDVDGTVYAGELAEAIIMARKYGAEFIWKWPRITDRSFFKTAGEILETAGDDGPDGIMVENTGDGIAAADITGDIPLYGGQGLNIFNHSAVGMFSGDYRLLTLSCELNRSELKKLCGLAGGLPHHAMLEYVVHGPAELLVSETDLIASSAGNEYSPGGSYGAADSTGRIFPVRVDGYGRTHVYNSAVTCLIDALPEVLATGVDGISLDLRLSSPGIVEKTVNIYKKAIVESGKPARERSGSLASLKKEFAGLYCGEITAGHFNRGV
jgi:putative protease